MYFEIFTELETKSEHSGNFSEACINVKKKSMLVIAVIFKRCRDEGF